MMVLEPMYYIVCVELMKLCKETGNRLEFWSCNNIGFEGLHRFSRKNPMIVSTQVCLKLKG